MRSGYDGAGTLGMNEPDDADREEETVFSEQDAPPEGGDPSFTVETLSTTYDALLDEAQATQRAAFRLLRRWHVAWQTGPHDGEALRSLAEETHAFLGREGGLISPPE